MADQMPLPNLSVEAMPWAREMQRRLEAAEGQLKLGSQGNDLANRGQNSTMNRLTTQVADLAAAQAASDAALTAALAALGGQVIPATGVTTAVNFSLTGSDQILAQLTFTQPGGYTKAVVTGMGGVTATSASSGDKLFARIGINGSAGPDMGAITTSAAPFETVPCFNSAVLTGLTPGGTFTVDVRGRLMNGAGSTLADYAQVAAMILFMK